MNGTLRAPRIITEALKICLFGIVCLATIQLGVNFALDTSSISLVWPVTGVALAVLLLGGQKYAAGFWAALLISNVMRGTPLVSALGVSVGSAGMVMFGAHLLLKHTDFRRSFDRVRDVLSFVVISVILSPLISATSGVLFYFLAGVVRQDMFAAALFTWWVGDAMGVLVVTPAILIWATVPFRKPALHKLVEAAVLVVLLLVFSRMIFGQSFGARSFYPLAYLIFPFLIWGALRFDQRMVATLTPLITLIAVLETARGFSNFNTQMVWTIVVFLWAYLATMAITAMLLAATLAERRNAERAINNLQLRFSRAFHSAPVAIWLSHVQTGRFADVNEEFCTVLGYTRDELIGRTSLELNIWETPEIRARIIERLKDEGRIEQIEARLRNHQGNLCSGSLSLELMEIDDEPHALSMFHDLTARLEAEEALRQNEAHYRQLFEGIDDPVFVHDLDANILDVNEATCRTLGYTRDELLRLKVTELDKPEFAAGFPERLRQQLEQGYLSQIEGVMVAKDGREIYFDVNTKLITYRGKQAILAVDRDITERQLSEQRLRESEARYRAIVEDQTEMICRLSTDWKLTFVNDAFCRYYDTTQEALVDTYFRPVLHPEDEEKVLGIINSLSANNPVITAEYRVMMPYKAENPAPRWHQWTHRAIVNEQGEVVEYQLVGKDITMLKEIEKQRMAVALEHEKVQILADFIAAASHDFRTPLSVINTSAYLINRVPDEAHRKRHLEQIQDQTYQIERLIDGLLTMSRLDRGDVFRFKPVNLNIVIQQIELRKRAEIEHKELKFTLDLAPELPVIDADANWVHTAIMQLIDNAIHYTPTGGSITVKTCVEHLRAAVIVSDTGIGISDEDMPNIFKRLYRGEGHRPVGGQGLGLPMVQRIAEAHQGRVEVASTPGVGSTFRLLLPVKHSDRSGAPSPSP